MNGFNWELFNLVDDPTQTNDLSAKEPDRLRMMQELWLYEASRNQVLPLNNSQVAALTAERPGPAAGRTQFVYTAPMTSNQFAVAPSILNRSYRITAEIEVPQGGANGVLVTQGGRFSGYGLYLKDGKPTFTMNLLDIERPKWQGADALPPGKHTIVFDWKMDPQGMAGRARRHRHAVGQRQAGGAEVAAQDHAVHLGLGRDLRRRPRYRDVGKRFRLPRAVRLHRQAGEDHLRSRRNRACRRRPSRR